MKKESFIISLTNPCNEDWENMTANEKGRHCASCNKTVVDFSLYTDKQLLEFFKNVTQGVCGHIPKYQLERVISVQQPNRFSFLRKLALGTAIASWFGMTEKADAQQKFTPHPVRQAAIDKSKAQRAADSLKHTVTFTFVDAKTGKAVQNIYGTFNAASSLSADTNGKCKVYVADSLIGKKATFYFYSEEYDDKEMEIELSKLPMHKKIFLNPRKAPRVMVNGGLGIRTVNDK